MSFFKNFKNPIRKIPFEQRREIISEISDSSSPGFDFFLLVVLSTSIATLGLITDSAAVIIGAMLVAPLMSPIIGIGLASIIGRNELLKNSISAVFRGAILAILLSALITWGNNNLPFVSFQELPGEILSRTHPSPIDLVIALAGGLAAAYSLTQPQLSAALPGVAIATALMPPLCTIGFGLALQRWDVAGGAALLFITNTVTIAFAAALVFFLLGFNPYPLERNRKVPQSLQLSLVLLLILLVPLTYVSVQFVQQATENRLINDLVTQEIAKLNNVELVDLRITRELDTIKMDLAVRTNTPIKYEQVVALQEAIVEGLNQSVSLSVNQIFAERLDPLIPPTPTFTPTNTSTATPGPSPTPTNTITPSPTATVTNTATLQPTLTPTFTPTPAEGKVFLTIIPAMRIYQYPGGPVIGLLYNNQKITILPQEVVYGDLVWVEIIDSENRQGWVPKIYIVLNTPTPTPTYTITPTFTERELQTATALSLMTSTPTPTQ